MNNFIPVNEPYIGQKEKELVNQCLDTGWISSEGPFVEEFEDKFKKYVNRDYGIACSSGSAALDIALAALEIGPGDEVILPTFTIISCASSILNVGAKPVVVDADPLSWNMKTENISNLITSKTKAIMAVHIYGLPVNMDPIIDLARKHNLFVIEDAAELIGGLYKNKKCGSFGDISTVSFYPNKQITTGEGGMVLTNSKNLAERCKSLRNLCFNNQERFIHKEIGWNYRMTNLQAALGLGQIERIDSIIDKKKEIGKIYNDLLEGNTNLQLPLRQNEFAVNLYWVYGIVLDKYMIDAKTLMQKLKENGIGTRPFFYPMHKQPVFNGMNLERGQNCEVSERLYKNGLYLPSGITLNYEKISRVVETLLKLIK